MFDNIKSELSDYKKKAEKLQVQLEKERASKKEEYNQVLSLLGDVKESYDRKMKGCPKDKDDTNKDAGKDKTKEGGKSKQQAGRNNADTGKGNNNAEDSNDWGNVAEDWCVDTNKSNDDASNSKKNKNKSKSNDANSNNNNKSNTNNENCGKKNKKNKNNDQNNQSNDNDETWNSATQEQLDDEHDDKNTEPKSVGWGTTTASAWNNTLSWTTKGWPSTSNKNDALNQDSEPAPRDVTWGANDTENNKKSDDWSKSPSKKGSKDTVNGRKEVAINESLKDSTQDYMTLKDQILTYKLEKRVQELALAKIERENEALKKECDEYKSRMVKAKDEQQLLNFRIRGVLNDLCAANDQIKRLTDKIDELERERLNRTKDMTVGESRRKDLETKYKDFNQKIEDLQAELESTQEEKNALVKKLEVFKLRNEMLEKNAEHLSKLNGKLRQGCIMVEDQAKTFEVRHASVVMSKADLERELVQIKEEASSHITQIAKLQNSNAQLSAAFVLSLEEHEKSQQELVDLHKDYSERLEAYKKENYCLTQHNKQLQNLIDHLQANGRSVRTRH